MTIASRLLKLLGHRASDGAGSAPVPEASQAAPSLQFDYVYRPSVRALEAGEHGRRLLELFDSRADAYREHLEGIRHLHPAFRAIPARGSPEGHEPYWLNDWFEGLDAMSLYYLLATRNPGTYLEVGSGNSTKFARRAIVDQKLRTKIVSIDPEPRAQVNALCDEVVRMRCEDADPSLFSSLNAGDMLFIDNSHRSFQGSDVTVFFSEILPVLPKGLLVGIHDIFLPRDYPDGWRDRFYNEQYLLLAFLTGGMRGGRIELPNAHLVYNGTAQQVSFAPEGSTTDIPVIGCAFWMTV